MIGRKFILSHPEDEVDGRNLWLIVEFREGAQGPPDSALPPYRLTASLL